MTYTHLTSNELAMIEAYYNNHQSVCQGQLKIVGFLHFKGAVDICSQNRSTIE